MRDIDTKSPAGIVALMSLRGLGPTGAERLAERFGTLGEVFAAEPRGLRGIVTAAAAASLRDADAVADALARAARTLDQADRLGVRVLSVHDGDYPAALRDLQDRPPILYAKGDLRAIERSVACIGTREPSEFGRKVTAAIVRRLVEAGWTIVSGLAIGVDELSHATALRSGGRTVAVMGGGLDGVYPRQNARLADEIVDGGGALLSEQAFGIPPAPRNLVQRDRLQSGLSVATFVMQTDVKGGSMHTVRFTLMQGRLLFAPVPRARHAEEPKSRGILALTQVPGRRLSAMVGATGEYAELLLRRFGENAVAIPLESGDDYPAMLDAIEGRLSPARPGGEGRATAQISMI